MVRKAWVFSCSSKLNILVRETFYTKPNSNVSFQILVQHNTFNTKTIFNIFLPFDDIKKTIYVFSTS